MTALRFQRPLTGTAPVSRQSKRERLEYVSPEGYGSALNAITECETGDCQGTRISPGPEVGFMGNAFGNVTERRTWRQNQAEDVYLELLGAGG